MDKYRKIFSLAWQTEFQYRTNFVIWRLRNILFVLMTYFLWTGIYAGRGNLFGYSREQMMTYIFLMLMVKSVVLAAKSPDVVGGEIASGELSNYLLKPMSYFKYWWTRDVTAKVMNFVFSLVELSVLYYFLQSELVIQKNIIIFLLFIIACVVSALIYYFLLMIFMAVSFWTPENTWGGVFLLLVLFEVLGGMLFPLDILPTGLRTVLFLTPFPYLIYVPVKIWLGTGEGLMLIGGALVELGVVYWIAQYLWSKGLKVYAGI
jgi:ABC-2 type transport system permease protein